ncbi:7-cyano-7-deazaguanine synthase QueC [Patescibacteria group bacterium]|nr:7-cyano-7-deazaguanine synthase QueC [Patescibacteria group bacterium]MBU1015768.1 7-cyano-7-deazaguanine synthase QueC [Patescibacteria group bacterium]MBU1685176.1 7-cyano-7-deazaguanine synthase QueC [Patescibacteria group bacterium]MBU1938312.1 7-cyano-7-deazaguanine synthase QueC [Patescibacteria group bacterium]
MTKVTLQKNRAIVLHSGGQDSTTCLAWALKKFKKVHLISFDYGQRHKKELKAAKKIAKKLNLSHKTIKLPFLSELTANALTDKTVKVKAGSESRLPSTFVDGRNMVFLTAAAIYAKQKGIPNLVTGVCQTDYSGYPDCRNEFIKSIEKTLRLAMEFPFKIHTPLMFIDKAETVRMMQKLGSLELLKYTHTCYEGRKLACGLCPACKLRLKGFRLAKVNDPIKYEPKTVPGR